MKLPMTLEDHLATAHDLAMASKHLTSAFFRCQEHYSKNSIITKTLWKLIPCNIGGIMANVKSQLDSDYHISITDKEFEQYGHIYYRSV